jgi:hypothetical protein
MSQNEFIVIFIIKKYDKWICVKFSCKVLEIVMIYSETVRLLENFLIMAKEERISKDKTIDFEWVNYET